MKFKSDYEERKAHRAALRAPCVEACQKGDAARLNELLSCMSDGDRPQIIWDLQTEYDVFIAKMLEKAIGGVVVSVSFKSHHGPVYAKISRSDGSAITNLEIWHRDVDVFFVGLACSNREAWLKPILHRYKAAFALKEKEHTDLLEALKFIFQTDLIRATEHVIPENQARLVALKVGSAENLYLRGTFASVLEVLGDPEYNRHIACEMVSKL